MFPSQRQPSCQCCVSRNRRRRISLQSIESISYTDALEEEKSGWRGAFDAVPGAARPHGFQCESADVSPLRCEPVALLPTSVLAVAGDLAGDVLNSRARVAYF